jgi:GR25 family glycosyltransferase involved in LPS biosynthesis
MEAFCINLDRQPEKFEQIVREFDGILSFTRVSAIDGKEVGTSGQDALYRTNVKLFTEMAKLNKPFFIVCEDDVYRCECFGHYWPKIVEFINNPKNVWDFISLDFFLTFDKPKLEVYTEFLYRVGPSRCAGFMIYNTAFVVKNLSYLSNTYCLDMSMKHNPNLISLIPKELIIKQIVAKHSTTMDYNTAGYEGLYSLTMEYLKANAPETCP